MPERWHGPPLAPSSFVSCNWALMYLSWLLNNYKTIDSLLSLFMSASYQCLRMIFSVGKHCCMWSDLPVCFSTSYTSHNFHLIQWIRFTTLMNPWCYFTRTSPSLPTSEWESTSTSRNFIAFSIISHQLLFLAQLITTTPNNRSASTLTSPRMLTVQWITKMSILKWLGGWSTERRCSNTLLIFEGAWGCRLHIITTRLECLWV